MASDTTPSVETIGNYDLLDKIAEGGMGAVYRAKHRLTGDIVAIKIVPPATARNVTLMRRFEREFTAAHEIDHPNVVKAIEFCGSGSSPFLVMEYVDGLSLGQKIDRDGRMSEEEAKRIIVQVCQGLHRAHKHNLVHRDIKPDNILLTKDGTAKITDLGLVKGMGEEEMNLTRTGRGLGTPHFMAPEQFRDAKNADVRCDVYSIGATMYMMVTGMMPFDGAGPLDCWMKKIRNDFVPPRELNPDVTERTNWAILRAMSAVPERRPATCREFVEDLLGQSTRQSAGSNPVGETGELWYLVYQDEIGESHTVKGTTDGIRRAIRERLLGDADNILAARVKTGPFHPLMNFPEYRDLIITPEPLPAKGKPATPSARIPTPGPGESKQPTPTAPLSGRGVAPSARFPQPSGRMGTPPLRPARSDNEETAPYDSISDAPAPEYELPHIQLESHNSGAVDFAMWLLLTVLAMATAVAVYFYFFKK